MKKINIKLVSILLIFCLLANCCYAAEINTNKADFKSQIKQEER